MTNSMNAIPSKFPQKVALKKPATKTTSVKKKAPKKGTGRR